MFVYTMPDGSGAVVPRWMTERESCATLSSGPPRCSLDALRDLRCQLDRFACDRDHLGHPVEVHVGGVSEVMDGLPLDREESIRQPRSKGAERLVVDGSAAGGSLLTRRVRVRTRLCRGGGARRVRAGFGLPWESLVRSSVRDGSGRWGGLRGDPRSVRWPTNAHLPRAGRGEQVHGADAEGGGKAGQRAKGQVLLADLHPSNVDA